MSDGGMFCGHCGTHNDKTSGFCGHCGNTLGAAPKAGAVDSWKCGACGHTNSASSKFCGLCGAPPGAAPLAPGLAAVQPEVLAAHAGTYAHALYGVLKTTSRRNLILIGGGVAVLMVILAVIATQIAPHVGPCTYPCGIRPPENPALLPTKSYTNSKYGYTLAFPSQLDGTQNDSGIEFDTNRGIYHVYAMTPGTQSPDQIAQKAVSDAFPGAQRVFQVPGAEIGYYGATGFVYDLAAGGAAGNQEEDRIVVMVAVRKGIAIVELGVGPMGPPQGHPNPSLLPLGGLVDLVGNTIRWQGDPTL